LSYITGTWYEELYDMSIAVNKNSKDVFIVSIKSKIQQCIPTLHYTLLFMNSPLKNQRFGRLVCLGY
jgi:hypothetical protein